MCHFSYIKITVILYYVAAYTRQAYAQRHKTIYQKIQQEPAYSDFNALIRNNRVAKLNMHFDNLTVFAPDNRAFKNYKSEYRSEIAFYHMSFEVRTLDKLRTTGSMRSALPDFPPLWIAKVGRDTYVNNAKILHDKSQHVSQRRNGDTEIVQALHVIDEVLDPIIPSPVFQPTAYDFLSSAANWRLDAAKTVTSFFHKVQESNLADAYRQEGGHTFFIPVDAGIDAYTFKMINRHTIYGHIVPDSVLFTRPAEKDSAYDTMANDRFIYIVVSFEERDGKLFVKGLAGGDLGNGNGDSGEFVSEVIFANIPVKNGVVHLVSQPLGIFNRTLKPFPYLPVLELVAKDPELAVFYDMGERTGFNEKLKKTGAKFTYFVPKDRAWARTRKYDLEPTESDLEILNRHLLVSETAYSMERLLALSRANNFTDIELETEGGKIRLTVLKIGEDYYVKWGNRYVKVLRPDFECPDGIVHVLAGPIARFRKVEGVDAPGENRMSDGDRLSNDDFMKGYWRSLRNVWSNIF